MPTGLTDTYSIETAADGSAVICWTSTLDGAQGPQKWCLLAVQANIVAVVQVRELEILFGVTARLGRAFTLEGFQQGELIPHHNQRAVGVYIPEETFYHDCRLRQGWFPFPSSDEDGWQIWRNG